MKKIFVLGLVFSLVSFMGGLGVHMAQAATTNMDLTMSAGALIITSSATATLSGLTVSTTTQTSTGSIANVSVIDTRGSGASSYNYEFN